MAPRQFLLSLLALAYHVCRILASRAIAMHTDVKMDDKGAISLALHLRDAGGKLTYDKIYLIMSGVWHAVKGAQEAHEYIDRMIHLHAYNREELLGNERVVICTGTEVNGKPVDHEVWWKEIEVTDQYPKTLPCRDTQLFKDLNAADAVDIIQVSPSQVINPDTDSLDPGYLYDLFAGLAHDKIKYFLQLAGYNSQLEIPTPGPASKKFMQGLRYKLNEKHPKAIALFVRNSQTFINDGAGNQDYKWMQTRYPEEDVRQACQDPFWLSNIEYAGRYASMNPLFEKMRAHGLTEENDLEILILIARTEAKGKELDTSMIKKYGNEYAEDFSRLGLPSGSDPEVEASTTSLDQSSLEPPKKRVKHHGKSHFSRRAQEFRQALTELLDKALANPQCHRELPDRCARLGFVVKPEFRADQLYPNPGIEMGDANAVAAMVSFQGELKNVWWNDENVVRMAYEPDKENRDRKPQGFALTELNMADIRYTIDKIMDFKGMEKPTRSNIPTHWPRKDFPGLPRWEPVPTKSGGDTSHAETPPRKKDELAV